MIVVLKMSPIIWYRFILWCFFLFSAAKKGVYLNLIYSIMTSSFGSWDPSSSTHSASFCLIGVPTLITEPTLSTFSTLSTLSTWDLKGYISEWYKIDMNLGSETVYSCKYASFKVFIALVSLLHIDLFSLYTKHPFMHSEKKKSRYIYIYIWYI